MIHEVPLEEATLHGYFSSVLPPVLSVDPGDSVRFQSLNARWHWEPDTDFVERDAQLHDGHALTGPIEVRGARAGQTLVVSIDEVTPRNWGVTFAHGKPFRWRIDGDTATHRCQLHSQHIKRGTDGGDWFVVGGHYDDRLTRTAFGWRITHRVMAETWRSGNPDVTKR